MPVCKFTWIVQRLGRDPRLGSLLKHTLQLGAWSVRPACIRHISRSLRLLGGRIDGMQALHQGRVAVVVRTVPAHRRYHVEHEHHRAIHLPHSSSPHAHAGGSSSTYIGNCAWWS